MNARGALIALVLVLAGCGGSSSDSSSETPADFSGDQGGVSAADRENARSSSKTICRVAGPKGIAHEYGGNAADEISAAQAYAEQSYIGRLQYDARRGCLAGFDVR